MSHQQAAPETKVVDNGEKPPTPMPPSPPKLERMPSIDSEPKTLLGDELNVAREAALKIINSHTREEALKIFLTDVSCQNVTGSIEEQQEAIGLVPVEASSVAKQELIVLSDYDDDDDE